MSLRKDSPDFYPTPTWGVRPIVDLEFFDGLIWEPACGNGAMAEVFKETGYDVRASDLYDYGYGESEVNFLAEDGAQAPNIVTNPPFNLAEEFVHAGLRKAENKLCLLLRLAFLESATRYNSVFSVRPPTRIWVFSERITFYPYGVQTAGSGTTAHAWFVWDQSVIGAKTEIGWIPPTYKGR